MIWTTPKFRHFASRLIAFEAEGKTSTDAKIPVACFATEKLRPHLAALMGRVGYRSLLARALVFSVMEHPWLGIVSLKKDGSLQGFDVLAAEVDGEKLIDGCITILANLLGLLETIIGELLMLRLVHDVWPEVSPDDN